MAIYSFEGKVPAIHETAFVADSAQIIGNVKIKSNCYIGPTAVIRGDYGTIHIGEGTAIEEGCIIHARPQGNTIIGKRVTVGHGAMIHSARIEDYAVIGMRAVISNLAVVGKWCIIGEMGLVKNGQKIPQGKIAVGIPVRIAGDVTKEDKKKWDWGKNVYIELCARYYAGLKKGSRDDAAGEFRNEDN